MDLVAIGTDDRTVEVFRIDGGRAFGCRRMPNLRSPWPTSDNSSTALTAFEWRNDGMNLSLLYADGLIELIDSQLGKVTERIWDGSSRVRTDDAPLLKLEKLFCSFNIIDPTRLRSQQIRNKVIQTEARQKKSRLRPKSGDNVLARGGFLRNTNGTKDSETVTDWDDELNLEALSLDDVTSLAPDPKALATVADLPRQLALMDVEEKLPDLVPTAYANDTGVINWDADSLTNKGDIDRIFNPERTRKEASVNSTNVTLATREDGSVKILLYDAFTAAEYTPDDKLIREKRILNIASHPFTTRFAITMSPRDAVGSIDLQLLDLAAISSSRHLLGLTIRKIRGLGEISRYILQTIVAIRTAWKSTNDLPSRFMRNANITLEEKNEPVPLVAHFYTLAATGFCTPPIREWLVDEIGEHGHKRWETAVTNGYSQVRTLVFTNLIPAIDRAAVIASRLRSLARTPDLPIFDVDDNHLTRIIATLDTLRTLAHTILSYTLTEAKQAHVFLAWLQHTIAFLAADDATSSSAEEAAEKASAVDHSLLFSYIEGAMTRSHLHYFLSQTTAVIVKTERRPGSAAAQLKPALLAQILDRHRKRRADPRDGVVDLPDLLHQGLWLRDQVDLVLQAAPAGFERDIRTGKPLQLAPTGATLCDLRIVSEAAAKMETDTVYAACVESPNAADIVLRRMTFSHGTPDDGEGTEDFTSQQTLRVTFPRGHVIRDAKFADDDVLAVLLATRDRSRVVRVTYSYRARIAMQESCNWEFLPQSDGNDVLRAPVAEVVECCEAWEHPKGVGDFVPAKMYARAVEGDAEGDGDALIVLLERDGMRWDVRTAKWS